MVVDCVTREPIILLAAGFGPACGDPWGTRVSFDEMMACEGHQGQFSRNIEPSNG